MMNRDSFADTVAGDVTLLAAALQGLYLRRVTPGRAVGVHDVTQFLSVASGMRLATMEAIVGRMNAWRAGLPANTDAVEYQAQQSAKGLHRIAWGMTTQLVRRLSEGKSLEQRLLSNMTGPFGQLVQRRFETETLKATDEAGRVWEASMLARVVARSFAVQTDVLARADAYRAAGITTAYVRYPDPEHEGHGAAVDLTDEHALLALRQAVFHPNSSATLDATV